MVCVEIGKWAYCASLFQLSKCDICHFMDIWYCLISLGQMKENINIPQRILSVLVYFAVLFLFAFLIHNFKQQ